MDIELKKQFSSFTRITGSFLLFFALSIQTAQAAFKDYAQVEPLHLALFGEADIVHERLSLDPNIRLVLNPEKNTLDNFDTVFIHNTELNQEYTSLILERVHQGSLGLVISLGENISEGYLSLLFSKPVLINDKVQEKALHNKSYGQALHWSGSPDHPLAKEVAWKSSTQVQEFSDIYFPEGKPEHTNLLLKLNSGNSQTDTAGVLFEKQHGKGKIYIFSPWLKKGNDAERLDHFWSVLVIKNEGAHNYTFYNWAYFNWILNFLVYDAADKESSSYAHWPYSPIPHDEDIAILYLTLGLVLFISLAIFWQVRKHSLANPEILNTLRTADYHQLKEQRLDSLKNLIRNSHFLIAWPLKLYYAFARLFYSEVAKPSEQWEKVGFIRPLAGFQMIVACIYISVLPILLFAMLMLNYVAPFPQSLGMTSWVSGAFSLLFTIFDLGTGIAMIKYFAQYRIKNPAKAMQYVQFYIWFQLISGIIQITLLSIATANMAPDTAYAFLSWIIIFKLLTQFPGFAAVFHNIFRALQRYDLMILTWVLPIPFSAAFAFIGMIWIRSWGLANPVYGELMGLALGDVIPAFVGSWVYIFVSILIYKLLGFSLKATFSAHFDKQVVKQSLSYGLRYTPGAIAPMLSGFALPLILSFWLNNYLELHSLLAVALWINFLIRGPGYMLYSNLLPSISEAFSHKRYILSSHYIDQALKWSLMFLGGVLPYFIILGEEVAAAIMPEQWAAASQYIALAVIFGAIEFLSALPDESFKAVGKPQLFTAVNVFDHMLRIILMLFLIPEYQIYGVLYAYIISASLRCVISWFILSKFILKLEISWWQSVFTPFVVSCAIFLLALTIKTFYSFSTPQEALPLVLVFFAVSPVFYFISALMGGFDKESLKEFEAATSLNIVTRLLSWIPMIPTHLGVRLSPLHGKFPLRNWQAAQDEAAQLTKEKVSF